MIKEIEVVVNNRPLTFCYDDEVVLTPNNLIHSRRINRHVIHSEINDNEQITEHFKHVERIIDHFWKRWSREYLMEIRDIIGKDGKIRGVGLTTTTNNGTGRLKRPINKLYPFVTNEKEFVNNEPVENTEQLNKGEKNVEPAIKFISEKDIPVGGV